VSGAGNSALNGAYTDGSSEWNGKCYYFGPGGKSAIGFNGSCWELYYSNQPQYYSNSTNSSNPKLPPSGGWNGGVLLSYGPSLSFASPAVTVNETAGSVSLTINLTEFPTGANINYYTGNGTAIAGSDYTAVASGSAFINGGSTSTTINIGIINDGDYEQNETFTVTITSPDGAPVTGGTCTVTIVSDDPQAYVSVASGTMTAAENSGTVSIPISISTAVSSDVTVQYLTANGTAAAGSDYTLTSGTLARSPRESTRAG
jgi:hypothetical protein